MSVSEVLELELPSDPVVLPRVREQIRRWAAPLGWCPDEIADVILAVDEALTNVIRHAYGGEVHHVMHVSVRPVNDPRRGTGLEVCVRDHGKQVDPASIRSRDLSDLRPGGLGVHIIQSVMDSAEYARAPGGGMKLVMRKYQQPGPTTGPDETSADERAEPHAPDPHDS